VCVCVYVCMYVYMCVWVTYFPCFSVYIHTHTHTYIYTRTHTHTHIHNTHTHKGITQSPSEVASIGQVVKCRVISSNGERKRMELSLNVYDNGSVDAVAEYKAGEIVSGVVISRNTGMYVCV